MQWQRLVQTRICNQSSESHCSFARAVWSGDMRWSPRYNACIVGAIIETLIAATSWNCGAHQGLR